MQHKSHTLGHPHLRKASLLRAASNSCPKCSRGCESIFPLLSGIASKFPQGGSGGELMEIEGIVDGGMHAEEVLGGSSRSNRCTLRSRRRTS
jgi:hypothetical protein